MEINYRTQFQAITLLLCVIIGLCLMAHGTCPITSPTNASTLASATPTFSWSAVGGAVGYMLWFSKTSGQNDYQVLETDQTSTVPSNQSPYALPTDNAAIYAKLWSWDGLTWTGYDVCNYTTANQTYGAITSPANGTTLSGAGPSFSWTGGNQCTVTSKYTLSLGHAVNLSDYYTVNTDNTTATASGVPTDTSTVYGRLDCKTGASTWTKTYYTYYASGFVTSAPSPSSGAISKTSQAFTWSAGTGIQSYQLQFGTYAGGSNIQNFALTGTSQTVINLPAGTVYLRFWTYDGATWKYTDYTYTAS